MDSAFFSKYNSEKHDHEPVGLLIPVGKRIGKCVPLNRDGVNAMPEDAGDENGTFILCLRCGGAMRFTPGGDGDLIGRWACPECGRTVRGNAVYRSIDRENRAFLRRHPLFRV